MVSWSDLAQLGLFLPLLFALAFPLGEFMAHVYWGRDISRSPVLPALERQCYSLAGVRSEEMTWKEYAAAALAFNAIGIVILVLLQRFQEYLPLNPQGFGAVPWTTAVNTAVSFVTNTNWQAYAGEATMSYFVQTVGLTVQNFLSAATGMAVAAALIRGIVRQGCGTIGNFWTDLTRSILWILFPLSLILAIFLVSQGVIQNFSAYVTVHTLEGGRQLLAMGPVASQEAIKELGTNGGGFFNANSAHPFENPSALTSYVESLAILLIPAAFPVTFGIMAEKRREGIAILAAMALLFALCLGGLYAAELEGNPLCTNAGLAGPIVFEGKEVRFGLAQTSLFATATTAASCGAVNAMHDSFTPLGGLVPLLQMLLGEVIFGGVGAGFYGMLLFVFLTVFIAGLMVGRTPEYLGKKVESWEMKMTMIAILLPAASVLLGSAAAAVSGAGLASLNNGGPHGLSEILYAFASASNNNGSAFAGLNANTIFYNTTLAVAMLIGRFGVIVPVLAIAGNLATKRRIPEGPGTFPTASPLFALLLCAVVLVVGALTFFPALALGPIVEHLLMISGTTS